MQKNNNKKAAGVHREADGKFKKGHRLGGRGSRAGALTESFADAGVSIAEARRLVISQTVKNARAGVDAAVERLARLVLPQTRVTPGVFKGAATVSERAEAVLAAVESGAITAQEAAVIAKGALETLAQATEWRDVAERLDRIAASPAPALPSVRVVHVDAGQLPAPRAAADVLDADVEPSD